MTVCGLVRIVEHPSEDNGQKKDDDAKLCDTAKHLGTGMAATVATHRNSPVAIAAQAGNLRVVAIGADAEDCEYSGDCDEDKNKSTHFVSLVFGAVLARRLATFFDGSVINGASEAR